MAEMVGSSCGVQRRNGAVAGLFGTIRQALSRLMPGGRATRLQLEQWPDYLLRDIGLDRNAFDPADPRPMDRMGR
jgi:hypothetical protein